ncbi:GH32 C-terminal domain-containing protein [Blastopirellula sp. JC732]|uniref:GH32 C-terminal domain-containing protein n=1 Tax=Blastopirellula sediminis TaxID=2894196 RepID=A0A9X1MLI7_9BACT|nr:glycoside hydrolase family 32 protein [Blastopirellula sediminis]MCC9607329.1 GH32 C-terminal domain-containing protein [Blastopirellula sediminis]MCC9629378.1 GH32 C-terminal domain-containing protein [Blastopirellula sediminis]
MRLLARLLALALLLNFSALALAADSQADLRIADFEQETYGEWKTTGTAFGDGPAVGTLPGQMAVSGFEGKRLVNSFKGGDAPTGTLTSPPFTIERDYLKFLIGGGGYADQTCMKLLVDGQEVRAAVGPNTQPGGSESLAPSSWDVKELRGKTATIAIIDNASGGWGHINVDQIVQSNKDVDVRPRSREFTFNQPYLLLPIKNGAPKVNVELTVAGTPVRRYSTELAVDPNDVDWYAYFTIDRYRGQEATIAASRASEEAFALIRQADRVPAGINPYEEKLRPQFHFSQLVGWINDPNGMVYLDGEWHLYFQHNPVGVQWGNMTWGHAVSRDLVHWNQLPSVLFPGTMAKGACFSGGAVVDRNNTAGFKTGDKDVLVAFLTDTGAGESIAYSNDQGRTFTWYEGNPVVKHKGRDPKVIWYAYDEQDKPIDDTAKQRGGHWVMVVYDESEQLGQNTAFYTSNDLKAWTLRSHLSGYYECPELFELPVEGSADESRWVTFAADGKYSLGAFDGQTFTPAHEGKRQLFYGKFYAAQTFDNAPHGRRVLIGWMRMEMPGMPFNQAFTFPHELTLRETPEGVRMFSAPVAEIEKLYKKEIRIADKELAANEEIAAIVHDGELLDIEATIDLGEAKAIRLEVGGEKIVYDVAKQTWQGVPAKAKDGRVNVRVLLDRSQLEIWGNDGAVSISEGRTKPGANSAITIVALDGAAKLVDLKIRELSRGWFGQ